MQQLNPQQLNAATAPDGPVLVLAGAGSGKTRVLTNRILHLVSDRHVPPHNILAITFTNKAANEMKNRLLGFNVGAEHMHLSTIHSFCATVLREEAAALHLRSNFTIYSEEEKRTVIRRIVKDVCDDYENKTIDETSEIISQLKNDADGFLEFCATCKSNEQLLEFVNTHIPDADVRQRFLTNLGKSPYNSTLQLIEIIGEYQEKMTLNNALDFDDLLYFVHKLFHTVPDVLHKYQDRFRYILIDEFQDTNKVQYEIFKMLASKYRNIFVVGDDDQSIYSWRGADIGNILNFEKDFAGTSVFKLEQNYRSTKRILDVANNIISVNPNRYVKVLYTDNEEGVKVELFNSYSEQDEAYFAVQQIQSLHHKSGYRYSDCAILMRVNALSRAFEAECRRQNIPYRVFGGFKFFERKEIKDVIAYLNLIVNPYDSEALFRAFNVPTRRGIGDATVAKLRTASAEEGCSVIELISDERNMEFLSASTRRKLSDFYQLYSDLCQLQRLEPLQTFIHKMLSILDFRGAYLESGEDERAMNIDEFEQTVIEFAHSAPKGSATLTEFLQTVSLDTDLESDKNQSDYVSIATIHAVKGLEFKAVFVAGLDDGIFPSSRSAFQLSALEEERRLMYVAATRAKQRLFLTHSGSRFIYGQRKTLPPSKYFVEVYRLLTPKALPNFGVERRYDDSAADTFRADRPPVAAGKSAADVKKFQAGQKVFHQTFGNGMILNVADGIADVVFESSGKKRLNIKFAPLELM
jgi:DNA helicase-2/ATP-dependent DNA helicase PcrA